MHALARVGSESKLPAGAIAVSGNALDAATFADAIPAGATTRAVVEPPPSGVRVVEVPEIQLAG